MFSVLESSAITLRALGVVASALRLLRGGALFGMGAVRRP